MAKITCRLVPNQDAHKIVAAVKQFVEARVRPRAAAGVQRVPRLPRDRLRPNSPYMAAAKRAIEKGFGKAPVLIREGGSIPVVGTFKDVLGVDTLLLGWGQNTDNLHSPNEKFFSRRLPTRHPGQHVPVVGTCPAVVVWQNHAFARRYRESRSRIRQNSAVPKMASVSCVLLSQFVGHLSRPLWCGEAVAIDELGACPGYDSVRDAVL